MYKKRNYQMSSRKEKFHHDLVSRFVDQQKIRLKKYQKYLASYIKKISLKCN